MTDKPFIEYMRLDDYLARFHPRNPKDHDIGQIISSILRFGFIDNPTIDEGTSYVVAGHGRGIGLEQIRSQMQFSMDDLKHHNGLYQHDSGQVLPSYIELAPDGMWLLPIVRGIKFRDEAHVNAYLIAANRITELGGWVNNDLASILQELSFANEGLLEATGYDGNDLDLLLQGLYFGDEQETEEDDSYYSREVEAPIYTPSDKKPLVSDLFDNERTIELVSSINVSTDLSEDEKQFLIIAAQRHTVLDFSKIADYYAHSSQAVQKLMEDSALVIIDFDRAIELGFMKISHEIAELERGIDD